MNAAVGLGSLKEQKDHFRRVFITKENKKFNEEEKKRLQHGKDHEIDAVATLVGKILPAYMPDTNFREIGCFLEKKDGKPFLVSSPDGVGVKDSAISTTFEFKCPFPKPFSTNVFYQVPDYYIPQVLSQMNMVPDEVSESMLLCWSSESSTVFSIKNDKDLWEKIQSEAEVLYATQKPIMPKKKQDATKELKDDIRQFIATNTMFVGEFKSVTAVQCSHRNSEERPRSVTDVHHSHQNGSPISTVNSVLDIEAILRSSCSLITDAQGLTRSRATDVLVFMLSDLDRIKSNDDKPIAIPVYYGLSGSSLSMDSMRNLTKHVRHELKCKGIDVVTQGFDGQMSVLATSSDNGKSLDLIHEQKEMYKNVSKKNKHELVADILECLYEHPHQETTFSGEVYEVFPIMEDCTEDVNKEIVHLNNLLNLSVRELHGLLDPRLQTEPDVTESLKALQKSVKGDLTGREKSASHEDTLPNQRTPGNTEAIFDGFDIDLSDEDLLTCLQEIEDGAPSVQAPIVDIFESDTQFEIDFSTLMSTLFNPEESAESNETIPICDETDTKGPGSRNDERQHVLENVLISLKTSSPKQCDKWKNATTESLELVMKSATSIMDQMTVQDMKVAVASIKSAGYIQNEDQRQLHYKADYANVLSSVFGDGSSVPSRRKEERKPKSLKNVLESKLKKVTLTHIVAVLHWPTRLKEWFSNGIIKNNITLNGIDYNITWMTQPEVDIDGKPILTFLDFHHLLTNTRCHIGRHGYPAANIHREAWVKVAEKEKDNNTGLNLSFVEDGIDPQSNMVAQLFFSEGVEHVMRANGDVPEAEFCRLMRIWYQALDVRGLPCIQRAKQLLEMREWLLARLIPKLCKFPPIASYVDGIPRVNFLGLLISTERFLQLPLFVQGGTFNVRSLGSQMNETFFSTFRDLDPRSDGVLSPRDLPKTMSIACQLLETKLDPERWVMKYFDNAWSILIPYFEHNFIYTNSFC